MKNYIKMGVFKPKPNRPKGPNEFDKIKFKVKKLEVGDTFYTYDRYKNHIIGFLQDGDTKLVAYKCWLIYKNRWGYYLNRLDCALYEICSLYNLSNEDSKALFDLNDVNSEGWV